MKRVYRKKGIAGFTLVEVLIASAVFTLFITGVFSLYRAGSRMFVSGSWKLTRQKEVERFLTTLKERIEQASNASEVNPAGGTGSILMSNCNLLTLKSNTQVHKITSNQRLMMFTVCKPDMTKVNPASPDSRGLILYHCLMAVKGEKDLYTLSLHANTTPTAYGGVDYFNTSANFQPDITVFSNYPAGFQNSPAYYGFGSVPQTIRLTDVASCTITWEIASGTNVSASEKIVGIQLRIVNPGHPETFIDHGTQARVDYSVPVLDFDLGDF